MEAPAGFEIVLRPEDEYCHTPDAASNYNESMYFNVFEPDPLVGAWFRLGNRPNEGYAELSVCIYLPDGRVAFMFSRPKIESNEALDAGGMRFEVVTPFRRLRVTYEGKSCLLANPLEMAEPREAFRKNPIVDCAAALDYVGIAPMYGGRLVRKGGGELEIDPEKSFARAHYEQHMAATGCIQVGDERFDISGFGLRDKSWGPRYWQAVRWYRWLPISFGPDFGMMISVLAHGEGEPRRSGMVLSDGRYTEIRDARIESQWDEHWYQTRLRVHARTDQREYEVEGRVQSLIPLRNRRALPDGNELVTRITEGMTEYRCEGRVGYGMSEYLDQIVDGRPVGDDVPAPSST